MEGGREPQIFAFKHNNQIGARRSTSEHIDYTLTLPSGQTHITRWRHVLGISSNSSNTLEKTQRIDAKAIQQLTTFNTKNG